MSHEEVIALLLEKGFLAGWAVLGTELTIWEHEEKPPAPLTRPA